MKQFFIIGRPRSGNTLLRLMFDAHPQCKVPSEYPILHRILPIRPGTTYNSIKQKQKLLHRFFLLKRYHYPFYEYLQCNEERFTHDITSAYEPITIAQAHALFLNHTFSLTEEAPILAVGDMNPVYCFYIKTLMKHFPEAYFIFLIRNPFDQISLMRKIPTEFFQTHLLAIRWNYVTKTMLQLQQKKPDKCIIVHYEQLVREPERTLKHICSFISIPYSPMMLQYYALLQKIQVNPKHTHLIKHFYSSLYQPVDTSRIHIHHNILSQKEIQIITYHCGKTLSQFPYTTHEYHPSFNMRFVGFWWKIYACMMLFLMKSLIVLPVHIRHPLLLIIEKLPLLLKKTFKSHRSAASHQ